MTKSRARVLAIVAGALAALTALVAVPYLLLRDVSFSWDPTPPGVVVAERVSPDSQLVATVTADGSVGGYIFTLRTAGHGEVIASRRISVTLGPHEPIVGVVWAPSSSRAIVTIDHDFGDNIVRVALGKPSTYRGRS